eukprot:COSAG02_NODE_38037_length_434_cov_0.913433_1_plen_34_part_10
MLIGRAQGSVTLSLITAPGFLTQHVLAKMGVTKK